MWRFEVPRIRFGSGFAMTVVVILSAIGMGILVPFVQPRIDAVLLLALGAVLVFPILKRIRKGVFDPFEPIVIFSLAYGVIFLARPIAILTSGNFIHSRPTRDIDFRDTFTVVLWMGLIGAGSFMLGYALPLGRQLARRVKSPPREFHTDTAVVAASGMAVLGVVLFGLYVIQAGGIAVLRSFLGGRNFVAEAEFFQRSTGYLYIGPYLLTPAALILIAIGRLRRSGVFIFLGANMALLVVLRAAPVGSRMLLLPLVTGLVVYGYVSRGKRPSIVLLMSGLVLAFVGSSFIFSIRDSASRQELGVAEALVDNFSHPSQALEPILAGPDANMVLGLAVVAQIVPDEIPYKYGMATVGDLFIRPIPRLLWPEKPLNPRAEVVSTLWPEEFAANIVNPEFSPLLYFYMDLGLPGVAMGMLVYGVVLRGLFEYYVLHQDNPVVQLLFAASSGLVVVAVRDQPTDTVLRFAVTVLPILIVFYVAGIWSSAKVSPSETPMASPAASQVGAGGGLRRHLNPLGLQTRGTPTSRTGYD